MITFKLDFKNGSSIKILESKGEVKRGKGSKLPYWYSSSCDIVDNYWDKETVEPFCNTQELDAKIRYFRKHQSDYILYVTGRRLSLWQRIWVDKISKYIRK